MTPAVRAMEAFETRSSEGEDGFLNLTGTIAKEAVMKFTGEQLAQSVPGLDAKKTYKVFRSAEAISTEETLKSFAKAPLIVGHHQITPDNINDHLAGYSVGEPVKATESMIQVGYQLVTPNGIDTYKKGKARQLSPAYLFHPVPASEEADYDFTMANIRVEHIAMVPRGKNGPAIRLHEEDDMAFSEEDKTWFKTMFDGLATALGVKASEEDDDDDDPKDKNKGKVKKTYTREEHQAELEASKRVWKDKELVQPLLVSEEAKKAVRESEDSLEVLAVALSMSEEEATEAGAAVLRGRAEERIASQERQPRRKAKSWENLNNPVGGLKPGERPSDAFYQNYAGAADRGMGDGAQEH